MREPEFVPISKERRDELVPVAEYMLLSTSVVGELLQMEGMIRSPEEAAYVVHLVGKRLIEVSDLVMERLQR